ncbi:MAG: lipoyl synthase [Oligoflexia bacterium]|nr:lipoyl synthase [Oligoflexia bacterium]
MNISLQNEQTSHPKLKTKIRSSISKEYQDTKEIIMKYKICTVCEEARCPNIGECWHNKTATFMLLGNVCTRHCRFCAVEHGTPDKKDWLFQKNEVEKLVEAIKLLQLKYVVLTSVTRDDYVDGGAAIFAYAVSLLKANNLKIEILTPDFREDFKEDFRDGGIKRDENRNVNGIRKAIVQFMNGNGESVPDVFAHNIETVRSITPLVRDQRASYDTSLELLKNFKMVAFSYGFKVYTKSGLMLGMGESEEEIYQAFADLRNANVDFLTIGQYLSPSKNAYPVKEYVSQKKFEKLRNRALSSEFAFRSVVAGPLVRSSYMAHKMIMES